jgi:hypothetical protein
MPFSPTSYYFIPFSSKYSSQRPVLKHPQSKLFPLMRETNFHTHTKLQAQKFKSICVMTKLRSYK